MKRFIRSTAGKIILFISFIISATVLAASVLGIIVFNESGIDWYRSPEDTCVEQVLDYELERYSDEIMSYVLFNRGSAYSFDYEVTDENGRVIGVTPDFYNLNDRKYTATYGILKNDKGAVSDFFHHYSANILDQSIVYYTVTFLPREGTTEYDSLNTWSSLIHIAYSLRYAVYGIALAALIICVLSFNGLISGSGRRNDTEEIVVAPLCKVPFDLLVALNVFAFAGMLYFSEEYLNDTEAIICGVCVLFLMVVAGVSLCMIAATNVKRKMFVKNTLIGRILGVLGKLFSKLWELIRNIPLIWKTTLAVLSIGILGLFLIVVLDGQQEELVVCWILLNIITVPLIMYIALMLRRLEAGGKALAAGNLSYQTDTTGMLFDLKKHGENLNSIAAGMTKAVEERLKSERMKTELITNVSHDIKTPLTSIINYSSLIGNELKDSDNDTLKEYSEVLVRQSESLKRLIEDLVEASKASTGNLEVSLAPCDASIFISQAGGEYEEKMKNAGLALVTKEPAEELRIMADGRRMWRIFDNLMNNICKYALTGTRVYLSLERMGDYAVITFKNTSKEPLDMTEEELMERFTRGDSSRSTEGNGLGLSIAKSLAELQGGRLNIGIDGDLFKAVLSFPLV